MGSVISPDKKNLNEMIGTRGNRYVVPIFQRGFSWERDEHIQYLWDDIINNLDEEYFLGTIIVYEDEKEQGFYRIIDGQQRLASLIILLAVIRDWFAKNGHQRIADGINNDFICFTGYFGDEPAEFKLTLNYEDEEFFNSLVCLPLDSEERVVEKDKIKELERTETNKFIKEAHSFFIEAVDEFAKNHRRNVVQNLKDLFEHVTKNLSFIQIKVKELESSFEIFETLNDRGKELAAGDLVKVFLCEKLRDEMGGATKNFDRIKDKIIKPWFEILENLNIEDPKIDKFLRHWLMSKTAKDITLKNVYKEFRTLYAGKKAKNVLTELQEVSKIYSYLIKQSDYGKKKIDEYLRWLFILKAERCYPFLIKAFRAGLTDSEILRLLKTVEILTVRWTTVCNISGKDLERLYLKFLRRLAPRKISEVVKDLKRNIPANANFEYLFNRLYSTQSKKNQIKYLLWRIEMKINPKSDIQPYTVNLEHILPQKPQGVSYWDNILGDLSKLENREDFEAHVGALGNLTLIGEKLNEDAKRDGFDKKREVYRNSGLELNKRVSKMVKAGEVWDYAKIRARQADLARIAKEVWPRS